MLVAWAPTPLSILTSFSKYTSRSPVRLVHRYAIKSSEIVGFNSLSDIGLE